MFDELVAKVDNIDNSGFVLKTKYDRDKSKLGNRIPDTNGIVKKTDYNTKLTELENEIPDISNLATKTALTTVESKIPDVSTLVKKTNYNTKVTETENKVTNHNHDKYIDTSEFNELAADVFNARIAQANLITKIEFDTKFSSLNEKIAQNKTKHFLVENEWNKLKTFDSSYFIGKSHFEGDDTQNYLVFQPIYRYLKVFSITQYAEYISEWKSKGLSNESIKAISTGSCLKQSKISYTHGKVVNIYIVYELDASSSNVNDQTLKNCLFGAVTLTKNAGIDKY